MTNKAIFLGNIYGLHDGYDGSVFDKNGISKTILASVGGIGLVMDIKILGNLTDHKGGNFGHPVLGNDGIQPTQTSSQHKHMPCVVDIKPEFIGSLYGLGSGYAGAVYNQDKLAPTLMTAQGGGRQPMVLIKQATKDGYIPCVIGGGGRFELSKLKDKERKSAGEWNNLSDLDNGEYP